MKKKSVFIKALSLLFVALFVLSVSPLMVFAQEPETEKTEETVTAPALVLTSESLTVAIGKKIKMTATVSNVETQPEIIWRSSDTSIASVDNNGNVKGLKTGKSTITATAVIGSDVITGEFTINVIANSNFLKNHLAKNQVLSYMYSYVDDYYYTDDKNAWQHDFGFGKIYDLVSPYLLLEYDYIRVFFLYDNKDWMLQMWKGQYGLIFYGAEIGIYNREHSEDGVSEWTMFNCPEEEDWLGMEMTLWHEEINGSWTREFTREYDKYWWCTGFKNGHLRQEEPADELRMTGRITFKDEEMARIVADGLKKCGFGVSKTKDYIGLDKIYTEGSDIHFCWQNISSAESTMLIKTSLGFIAALNTMTFFPLLIPMIVPAMGMFGLACLLVSAFL